VLPLRSVKFVETLAVWEFDIKPESSSTVPYGSVSDQTVSNLISKIALLDRFGGRAVVAMFSGSKKPAKINVSGKTLLYRFPANIRVDWRAEMSGVATPVKVRGQAKVIMADVDFSTKARL
jgi:hypothetical protein